MLYNTGQSLVFRPETGPKHSLAVNVSAGPLAYRYQVEKLITRTGTKTNDSISFFLKKKQIEEVFLHYGTDNTHGSEHRVNGHAFPAEVTSTSFLYIPTATLSTHLN